MPLEKRWSEYHPPPPDEKKEKIQKPKLIEHKEIRTKMKSTKRNSKDNEEGDDDDDYGSEGSDSVKKPRKTPPKVKDIIKAHSKPPVDKEGQTLPPPPIIGPDGKEVARPRDSKGNPLPIYVTPEGKPVFDEDGKPIALKFDKDGNPVLLNLKTKEPIPAEEVQDLPVSIPDQVPGETGGSPSQGKKENVPKGWALWIGLVDIVISLILAIYVLWVLVPLKQAVGQGDGNDDDINLLTATLVILLLGAIFAGLPIYGAKKDKVAAIIGWCILCVIFLVIQIYICSQTEFGDIVTILPMSYFLIRFLVAICTCIPSITSEEPNTRTGRKSVPITAQLYPGYGRSAPSVQQPQSQQVLVQQQQPVYVYQTATAAMPFGYSSYGYPGYGFGYPGVGGYYGGLGGYYGGFGGYYGGYGSYCGYGFGLGHHHHCHGGWDWW